MRGIRSFMGWTHIPDLDTSTGSSEDNTFAGPKLQTPGKISVQLPTDEWLCRKLSKLNLTLTDGYPSRSAEAGGLQRDQFLKPPRSQAKWYGCHPQQKSDTTEIVTTLSTDSSKLNSGYLRIARQAGIATSPPKSRPISQDTLRKWEKSARELSVICNQAAGFNRCLMKVQQDMQSQLKAIRLEHKGKSSSKLSTVTEELQFLMDFNSSICQAMAKSMEYLTDFVFVNMANVTLVRRDSYLKAGIKADTMAALRTAPLHISTLFPDTTLKQAEEDISNFDKGRSGSSYKKGRYHPYERQDTKSDTRKQDRPTWKNISRGHNKRSKSKHQYSSRPAKGQQPYKWQSMHNFVTGKAVDRELLSSRTDNKLFKCKLSCCQSCSNCPRALTKERVKSWGSRLLSNTRELKICQRCSGVAQHALVLRLGDHVQSGPSQPAQPAQSGDTAIQSDPSQKSDKSKSPCLAPRATKIKEQGFSEAVAARIEAPQRRSTRSVYEAKWAIFAKWCIANQVDFRSPPVKSVADFLMHLFEDKKLQPSTIDGYRSAIGDKLGNATVNISKDDNLTRLLQSFHRDRPKGWRGIPSWNLSLVLHQLTKAPFEPLREASLKHLTFKTVFLLAVGSGKRRSEIHAWQHKNIRHQSDWSKVSLFPSSSFLSKNQLAKEGPESVAPVVIPALAPTLDKSLKSDRSLCPVRALRYYLDRTSDLRQHKELVFVSFKKGFDKDISPATISSWIKQTVILCYELSDHQAHTLHQVKAHDVRAFAASKAFQSGVSLEQILPACHWKSHNTFTQFYLKDVAWADSELFHLAPVVAAQQIHHQARA